MKSSTWFSCLLIYLAGLASLGAVSLPAIFSDHAVLQKAEKVPIWGHGRPGEKIQVALDRFHAETVTDADGRWRSSLDLHQAGPGPFTLTVVGDSQLTASDVLVGEVWLCSGQSNMVLMLSQTLHGAEEIARSQNAQLRQFLVVHQATMDPVDDCEGQWTIAGPGTSGAFTAVGYYFGKDLQRRLGRPVGLIGSHWGGSIIERWLTPESLDGDPTLKAGMEQKLTEGRNLAAKFSAFQRNYLAWQAKYHREDNPTPHTQEFAGPDVSLKDWHPITLPGFLRDQAGLPDSGVVWLRREIDTPRELADMNAPMELGRIHDYETIYWDGKKLAETRFDTSASTDHRSYSVTENYLREGRHTMAIRLYSPGGDAGIFTGPGVMVLGKEDLSGEWFAKVESRFPPLSDSARAEYPRQPEMPLNAFTSLPSVAFNGMIHPLVPYGLRGILWYQGESNVDRAVQYRSALRRLITGWRKLWNDETLPFYICQLPNYGPKDDQPGESPWAELREAQASVLSLPATGLAVLLDVGDEKDIHPRDKETVGERLALIARAKVYGEDIPCCSPSFRSARVGGGKIRISFDHTDGGLVARALPATYRPHGVLPAILPLIRHSPDSTLEGFAICGADHHWVWANAAIEGSEVTVWSPTVAHPVAARYAWSDNPTCNLYNGAGLPAGSFRTDDFPLSTDGKHY